MKTLEDGSCVDINAYKYTVCEIWGDFLGIIVYCVSALSLHIESTDSMISTESFVSVHLMSSLNYMSRMCNG